MEQRTLPEKLRRRQLKFEYTGLDTLFYAYVEGLQATFKPEDTTCSEATEQVKRCIPEFFPHREIDVLHGVLPYSSEITASDTYKSALVEASVSLYARMVRIRGELLDEHLLLRDEKVARQEDEVEEQILNVISTALERNPDLSEQTSERVQALLKGKVDQLPLPKKPFLELTVESLVKKIPILYLFFRSDIPFFVRIWKRTQLRFIENPPEKTILAETGLFSVIRRLLGEREKKIEQEADREKIEYYYALTKQDYALLNRALTDNDINQIIQLTINHGNVRSDCYNTEIDFDHVSRLRQEVQSSLSDNLREAYYLMMLNITYLTYARGESTSLPLGSVISQEHKNFLDEFEELLSPKTQEENTRTSYLARLEERALYWFERIVPLDRRCSFVDRREIPYSTVVKGFEMCILNPSNYEIAQMVSADLPQGLTMDDIPLIMYIDVSEREVETEELEGEQRTTITDTFGTCTSKNYIVLYKHPGTMVSYDFPFEIVRKYITRKQRNDLRHELAHAWQNVMFERYPALEQHFLALLKRDQDEMDKDLFDPSLALSNYSQKELSEFDDQRYLSEMMAELWSISFNEEQLQTVQTELHAEAIILRCMSDEQFFQQFLSEHNIA